MDGGEPPGKCCQRWTLGLGLLDRRHTSAQCLVSDQETAAVGAYGHHQAHPQVIFLLGLTLSILTQDKSNCSFHTFTILLVFNRITMLLVMLLEFLDKAIIDLKVALYSDSKYAEDILDVFYAALCLVFMCYLRPVLRSKFT